MTFGFHLYFLVPPGTSLPSESLEVCSPAISVPVCFKQQTPSAAGTEEWSAVTARGEGFVDGESARRAGEKLSHALLFYSARHRAGFDLGLGQSLGSLGPVPREHFLRECNLSIRPGVHGLDIYPMDPPPSWFAGSGRLSVGRPLGKFQERISEELSVVEEPSKKLVLALKLYSAALFQADKEARFFLLIRCVEALAEPRKVADEACEQIDQWVTELSERGQSSRPELKTLCERVGGLKRESIGQACRRVVKDAGQDVDLFKLAYNVRSKLLHEGRPSKPAHLELLQQPSRVDAMVRGVLVARMGRCGGGAT